MAGKGIPQRHISRTTIRLSDRNVNEVCLYFKELRIYSATQTTLNPVIAVKALPKDAKTIGGGEKREETGEENEEPTLKLDFDPSATRKPGQVLKLYTTYDELTSKEGAKFGWVDKPGPKTRQEALDAIERESEKIRNRLPVVLKKYKRDAEGTLTTEVEQEVRIKALGRTIGSSVGRVSTQAFQAAGGIIDGNGKLRCPPGTPNANQFTDVDMSNCAVASLRTIVGSVRRVGSRLDELARIGSDMAAYGRVLTPFEREQQDRFKATRGSAVLDRNATVQANIDFDASVNSLLERFGVERVDASSSANADLIAGLHGLFREQYGEGREEEADGALRKFLFGMTELEKNDLDAATFPGGIFADAGSATEVFAWEGDFSPESIAANTERYDAMLKRTIISMHGDDVRSLLSSTNPEERKIAEAYIQLVREKHHAVQRESLMTIVHMQNKYPEATERLGQVRAFMAYDLAGNEGFLDVEGSTRHDFDEFGDLKAIISVNALGQALDSLEKLDIDFAWSDDGSLYLDTPGAASEVEKRAQLLRALEQVSDAIRYAEIVGGGDSDTFGYANQTSAARLEAAFGLDAVRGRARHVMLHEFGHVMQLHAAQQKIIEQYKKTGKVVIPDGKGGLLEYTKEPSLWSNDMWVKAVSSLHTGGENIYQFPPGGATRFEQSLVNLFAGRRYQQELRNAEIEMAKGEDVPASLKMALLEGSAEIFAQRELGILGGPEVEDSIAWMLPENIGTERVRKIPYDIAPGFGIDGPPDPDAPPPPDIPTNVDPPEGGGGTTINIDGPINITININYGTEESSPEKPELGWTDIAGHIYMDGETQWQPGSQHNLPLEQNPSEIRRFIDVAFGLGVEEGGPDPADPLGEVRQANDAYWKMTPEILDARYEKLDAEFKKLVAKSEIDGLSADEQAKMWLAAKGMRQILDANSRKSQLSTEDIVQYDAKGYSSQPGKYMRQIDTPLHPQQKRFRKQAIEKRKSRGYGDIVEVDDDELAHYSREIGNHAGDVLDGKDGFDGSSRKYERGKIRNTPGPTSKEKRRRNPEYKPTEQEIEDATLISDPSLVGRRKMDEMSADLTPEQKFVMESDEPVEMSDAWHSVSDALSGDVDSLRDSIDTSARARQRLRDGAGSMSKPDSKSQDELIENQFKDTVIPTLDILERATTDTDMSFIAAIELDEDLVQGAKIDHSGPLRGLLIDGESADSLKLAEPQTTKRVMVMVPKGSRAMHTKNAHDGDTDGVLIPPGTLEVMKVDPDGTVVLMPTRQKTKSEVLIELLDSVDGIDAERASFADSEKRALKSVLRQELKKTPAPNRSTRGASGDPAKKRSQTIRASSLGKAFRDSGSSFFGTESTNKDSSSLTQPDDKGKVFGRGIVIDEVRQAKSAELTKLFDELVRVRDGEGTSEEYWELFNEVSEQTKQFIFSSSPEKLMRTVEETVFKYHESFDDRPRMAITPNQLTDLIGEGVLKNAIESRPNSIASGLQKTFEKDNGLSDLTPDNMRSNFGYLTHSSNQKEIQDYLDGLPSDGLVRNARFFSNTDDFGQHQEFKVGGKSVELILVPETARRTAYTRGDVMDGGRQATPMLSSNRAEVLAAHISGPNSGNSEIDNTRETIAILDSSASGSFAAFGTPSGPTRSTRSRNDSPSAEAVIGGGIRVSDIEAIRIDSRDLERYDINPDDIGGREKLKKILAASGITGNLDEILDTLLSGDFEKQEQLSPEAQNLMSTFAKMRMVLGARKLMAEHNARGGQPELIFANPDGIDIGDIDSFVDLKHIDPNSSIEEKLFERIRYDAFGAVMRKMPGGNKEQLEARNKYRTTGRLSDINFDASLGERRDAIDDGSGTAPDGGAGKQLETRPISPKTVDIINQEVEKGRTSAPSDQSRVGKGQRTQLDVRRAKLISEITYDDETNELIVTWTGNEAGRGTERYTGFSPELIRVLEETYKDDTDGSTNPLWISQAVNHIANTATTTERLPDNSAHAAPLSDDEKERLRSRGLRSVRGTSGNTSTTPPSKRGVVDIFEDVHNLGDPNDPNSGLHGLNDAELFERYGIERTGNMSLSDGQEVFVVNDLETAAALLAAGYHVELGPDAPKPTLLVEASAMLQKQVDAFLKGKGLETNKVIDTCRLYSAGTNLWCEGGLGTVRKDMPQISGRIKGDDTPAARMVKAGVVKTDWKGGKRDADGVLTKLTPEEELRFNELKAKHAKLKDGTVIPDAFDEGEKEEFYSLVDWNDTEADFTKEYKEALKRLSKISNPDVDPDTVVFDEEGLLPTALNVSQGQIQMAKTGGMVKSMRNHDHSFKAYMSDLHPDIEFGSKEYYEYRNAWLYGQDKPDGGKFAVPFIDADGQKLNKDGDPIQGDAGQEIINQPWFTTGSIISTIEGEGEDAVRFVVDGHHRWASFAAYNELLPEEAKLKLKSTTLRIPIADALAVSKAIQEHFGIKAAVLGNETMFERADGIDPIDIDGKTSHIEKLFEIGPDGVAAAQTRAAEIYKELYVQQEGFGFVQSVSSRGSRRGELPPLVFGYDEVEEVDVPGKKAFRDNSTYVTENADGTFNAYTIENVPGTGLGYLKQAGDNHESLDEAKNAASKQKISGTSSTMNKVRTRTSTRSSASAAAIGATNAGRFGPSSGGGVYLGKPLGEDRPKKPSVLTTQSGRRKYLTEMAGHIIQNKKSLSDNRNALSTSKGAERARLVTEIDNAEKLLKELQKEFNDVTEKLDGDSREKAQLIIDALESAGDGSDSLKNASASLSLTRIGQSPRSGTQQTRTSTRSLMRPYRDTSDEELQVQYDKYLRYLGGPGDKGDGDFTYMRRSREFDKIKKEISRRASGSSSSNRASSPSAEAVPSTEAQKTWKKLHDLESKKKGAINDMTDSELAELGISRSSREGIIDGKPVYVAETQESAVSLMSLGYNVELGDGARAKKVKRAVAKLQEEIDAYLDKRADMSPEEKASYKIDSCRMYIANTNIFCGKNIGTKRMDMPQISGRMKGDDTVAARAAKAGLVKTSWEAREDLTPEERSLFDKLKARHPNPSNKFPEGASPLTDEEKKEFYSLVDWKDTEVDFVPKFLDHLRRVSGRDNIVTTRNGVDTSEFTASQGQIQAEKVSGMLAGIEDAHDGFVQWAESRGAKRGSKEYLDLRKKWLDGEFNGQIPILDENGQQKVKKGKPQFADPWWAMGTVISSKDGYIVDGHHRWAAVDTFNLTLGEGEPPLTINTQELDVGIFDALNLAKSYQTEIGIKQAKLGLEDPYAKAEGIPAMSADEFAQFDADTDTNVGKNYEKVRDSRFYVPDGPYVKTTEQKPTSGFIQRDTPRTTRDIFSVARRDIASTRSSRAPRSFSDDYPSMAAIGISPRSSGGPDGESADDALSDRQLAEAILSGASVAERKEMEQIAASVVADVQKQKNDIRAQIVTELGSQEALDELLDFEKPTPKAWTALSPEKRQAINEMLDRVSSIENESFANAQNQLLEIAERRRQARNANISAAKRVAELSNPSTRSSQAPARTGTRFVSDIARGVGEQVNKEKLFRDLSGAFKRNGASGVLSELRKTLRNDSSGWAIDYALKEGYISKNQAGILRKLASKLFKKPRSKARGKSFDNSPVVIFADLLSPPFVTHKEESWL